MAIRRQDEIKMMNCGWSSFFSLAFWVAFKLVVMTTFSLSKPQRASCSLASHNSVCSLSVFLTSCDLLTRKGRLYVSVYIITNKYRNWRPPLPHLRTVADLMSPVSTWYKLLLLAESPEQQYSDLQLLYNKRSIFNFYSLLYNSLRCNNNIQIGCHGCFYSFTATKSFV